GGRFPIKVGDDYLGVMLEPIQNCREVMDLLRYDAMLRAHDEDARGAMESCRALLCAARSIGDEPYLIAFLVRTAGHTLTLRTLERVLAQGAPPEDELKALQDLLEVEADNNAYLAALRGERAGLFSVIEAIRDGRARVSGVMSGSKGEIQFQDQLIALFP